MESRNGLLNRSNKTNKNTNKNALKLNESQLRNIVAESVKKGNYISVVQDKSFRKP